MTTRNRPATVVTGRFEGDPATTPGDRTPTAYRPTTEDITRRLDAIVFARSSHRAYVPCEVE